MANYGAVIQVSVKGQDALDKLEGSARKIESLIQNIKQQRNIFDQAVGSSKTRELKKNLENLVATFAGAREGARQFKVTVGGTEQTVNMYSKTLAGLSSQLDTFRSIANNAAVGTDQYRNSIVAANKVSNEFARTQAKAFKVNTSVSGMNVSEVLSLGKSIPNTIEGLTFYQSALEDVLKTVKIGSNEFRALENAIASTGERLGAARLSGQVSAITPALGPATNLSDPNAFAKRERYAKSIADLEYKQLITGQQIVKAKLTETQQEELQNRLAQASEALAAGELDTAKRLTVELRNQRILYERANRDQAALMRPTSMVAGAAESVTGKRPGGLPPVPGSPAAWLETGGVAQAEKVKQAKDKTVDSQKRLNSLLNSTQILEQKTLQLKTKGLDVDRQIDFLQTVENRLRTQGVNLTKQDLDLLDLELNALRNKLKLEKAVLDTKAAQTKANAAAAAPDKQKAKDRASMTQNALIGGAFPLLFGGGVGAVAGGFAGGFIPGNPMMSIVTSALGTLVDQFVAGVTAMGMAVKDLVGNFDKLKEANLFASKQQEFYIQKLIESGRAQEAANAIQQRLIEIIGTQGVQDLSNAGQAATQLNKTFAELGLQIQALIAGPLGLLLNRISEAVSLPVASTKATIVQQQLVKQGDTEAARKLGQRVQGIEQGPNVLFGLNPKQAAKDIEEVTAFYAQFVKNAENAPISLVDREKSIKQVEEIYTELKDKERAQQQLKIQNTQTYADLVLSIQRQQADLNLQYERRAQDLRISNAEKQLELVKAIGDAQLQQLQNESKARQIEAGGGTGLAAEITAALDTYDIEIKRIQQEAANAEEKAKLDILKLDVDNERFKLDNAKTIARTNLDNQIRIQRINEQINRQNDEVARRRYDQDIQVASLTLSNIRADAQANKTIAEAALKQRSVTEDQKVYYQAILNGFNKVIQESERAAEQVSLGFIKPSPLPTMAAAPTLAQPSTGALDSQVQKAKELTAQFAALAAGQNRANAEQTAYLALTEKTLGFVRQFQDQTKNIQNENEARKLRNRLLAEGVAPEIIEGELRVLELNRAFTEATSALDVQLQKLLPVKVANTNEAYEAALATVAELEATTGLTKEQEKLRDRLKEILDLRVQLGTAVYLAADGARTAAEAKIQTPLEKIQTRKGELEEELATLTNMGNVAIQVADGIGAAFSNSFKGIIDGSMSAREALAGFFQSVADQFLDMAAQIIAKWIQMTILNSILRLFPGGNLAGGIGGGLSSGFSAGTASAIPTDAGGWAQSFATVLPGRANGGPVSSGQMYMVGERGPELFVPGRSGTIVANDKMGGGSTNVVVNVDAKGSSVEGNEQGANQLGRVISAAVQSELIKQQRPGGLLAR